MHFKKTLLNTQAPYFKSCLYCSLLILKRKQFKAQDRRHVQFKRIYSLFVVGGRTFCLFISFWDFQINFQNRCVRLGPQKSKPHIKTFAVLFSKWNLSPHKTDCCIILLCALAKIASNAFHLLLFDFAFICGHVTKFYGSHVLMDSIVLGWMFLFLFPIV